MRKVQNLQVYSEDEKRKAAYALNLCAVSVSQIVEYNDTYILEQEYNAILNNLNLEEIPKKDDALLNILVELLNTITFFRIQDVKKQKIEKDYQRRLKNAMWSAIPSLSVITSGNPIGVALTLATQVGTGYMNYRREKANAGTEKENSEFELQITAMEQFNALRRELFTTAWRLAESYGFKEEWRLTENQIKQYNQILMDTNEYRKYARLEAIQSNFDAYPPFWYFFAHTALYISENDTDRTVKEQYLEYAKQHFEHYYQMNKFSLLREDQLAASALLEYADLLMIENTDTNIQKVFELIQEAKKKAGIAKDVLQLCAISFLKIGKTEEAASILKVLVNEDYNTAMNAKILSRIYVSMYLDTESCSAYTEYKILSQRVAQEWLFPMPKKDALSEKSLEEKFIRDQKAYLAMAYRCALQDYLRKARVSYEDAMQNLRPGSFSEEERVLIHSRLCSGEYSRRCIRQMNLMVAGLDTLSTFRKLKSREALIKYIDGKLRTIKGTIQQLQGKPVSEFESKDIRSLEEIFSFEQLTEDFYDDLRTKVMDQISHAQTLGELNLLESDLLQFCNEQKLPEPRCLGRAEVKSGSTEELCIYFEDDLLGSGANAENSEQFVEQMRLKIGESRKEIVKNPDKVAVYLRTEALFDSYFENGALPGATKYLLKQKAIAVVDDLTKHDYDLVLTIDGIVVVDRNKILDGTIRYDAVKTFSHGERQGLEIWYPDMYENPNVDLNVLYAVIKALGKIV